MTSIFAYLDSLFSSSFSLAITSISLLFKSVILSIILMRGIKNTDTKRPLIFLCGLLIGSMAVDIAWIYSLVRTTWFPMSDYRPYLFWLRISWGFFMIQYQSFSLFVESLVIQSSHLNLRQKIFVTISSLFFCFAVYLAFTDYNCYSPQNRPPIEAFMRDIQVYYMLFVLMLPSFFIIMRRIRKKNLPAILEKQVRILLPILLLPIWISEILQMFPHVSHGWQKTNSYLAMCLSTILITIAGAYCARKVITLRFLNLAKHVQTVRNYNFIDNFKTVLEQFSGVISVTDLGIITQRFFNEAYGIPLSQTNMYIRSNNSTEHISGASTQAVNTINTVDHFIQYDNNIMGNVLHDMKILIHDEVAFSNFYEPDGVYKKLLSFLNTTNADIFLPIYEKHTLIGYIIVERYAHPDIFFGDAERDEMLVFSSYLSNLVHLLYNKNFDLLLEKKREVEEDLHFKQQEIKQYKESFRSFLRNNRLKDVGVIFYKAKRFSFANKAAKDMIPVNLNTQDGHALTKIIKDLTSHVEEYRSPQTTFTNDFQGNKLIIAAFPHLEDKSIIITVYYPAISDVVKRQMSLLENPSEWDFLLYLETTESGKLINQLIPGSGEVLLNFKISLLKAALSKQAVLLETDNADDLGQMVEIIHHVSLRERLEVIALHAPCRNNDVTIKLFGINPVLNPAGAAGPALLADLNGIGTLFIENVHFLDLESQEYLADFLRYGMYRAFRSEQKFSANVRIICSTNQDLQALVQLGTFSKSLFEELKATALSMPSLADLPEQELGTLTDGFTDQLIKKNDLKSLVSLSDKEKTKLLHARPVSLADLKNRVQQLLQKKSQSHHMYTETQFDSSFQYTDPGLIEAARLGKHALRNPRVMAILWNKFKNQAKIAEFLDVNRSSVNRRCKEYNLE